MELILGSLQIKIIARIVDSFAQNVMSIPDYANALKQSSIVPQVLFEWSVEKI